jgi:hypothetical protein
MGDEQALCISHLLCAFRCAVLITSAGVAQLSSSMIPLQELDPATVNEKVASCCMKVFRSAGSGALPLCAPGPSATSVEIEALIESNITCAEISALAFRFAALEADSRACESALNVLDYIQTALHGTALPEGALSSSIAFTHQTLQQSRYVALIQEWILSRYQCYSNLRSHVRFVLQADPTGR